MQRFVGRTCNIVPKLQHCPRCRHSSIIQLTSCLQGTCMLADVRRCWSGGGRVLAARTIPFRMGAMPVILQPVFFSDIVCAAVCKGLCCTACGFATPFNVNVKHGCVACATVRWTWHHCQMMAVSACFSCRSMRVIPNRCLRHIFYL